MPSRPSWVMPWMSIYNALPSRGYEIRVWPARYPDERLLSRMRERLAPFILKRLEEDPTRAGTPTDPQRFSDLDLCEREASYGRSGFALQFQLDTSLSDIDRYPLKLSDLIVMDVDPEVAPEKLVWASAPQLAHPELPCVGLTNDRYYRPMEVVGKWIPYQGCVMAIDPAGRGADEAAYCVAKTLNGYIYVVACGGLKGGYTPENLQFLAELAKKHKVHHVVIESNFGDGMFTELLKPVLSRVHPCAVEEVRHSTQKERRIIDTLEPVMNQHKLVIDSKVVHADYRSVSEYSEDARNSYMLFYQMSRVTKDRGCLRHDDRLEAVAMAVNYWTTALAQDDNKKIQERKDADLRKELQDFKGYAFGAPAKTTGWFRKR